MKGKINPYTLWLTGLSGSGKTTIALKMIEEMFNRYGELCLNVDGDKVRKYVTYDLGYTKEDRDKNVRKIAEICKLIYDDDWVIVATTASPNREIREYARSLMPNFSEVYVKCPYKICLRRDPKGLYKKIDSGEICEFIGYNIPYDVPENPDLVLDTEKYDVDECVDMLIKHLNKKLGEINE